MLISSFCVRYRRHGHHSRFLTCIDVDAESESCLSDAGGFEDFGASYIKGHGHLLN